MVIHESEAAARVRIDKELTSSGWDLEDPCQVRLEQHTRSGRTDYLLLDEYGRPACVLEAKRDDLDSYDAKEQARGYAENLNAPFILLSNGTDHWFWNYERRDERDTYRIERCPSQDDLKRLRRVNLTPRGHFRPSASLPTTCNRACPALRCAVTKSRR